MRNNLNVNIHAILFLMIMTISSCKNTSPADNNIISVRSAFDVSKTGIVEEQCKRVSLIALETNDSILIDSYPVIKLISGDNIIIESNRRLFRFDRNGKFLNYIGKPGQGPEEYMVPGRVSYNDTDHSLYLYNRKLQNWTLDGHLVSDLQFNDLYNLQSVSILKPDTILAIRRNYTGDGAMSQFIQYYTLTGDLISETEFQSDSLTMDIAMFASPEYFRLDNAYLFRNEWDNEIYKISDKGISLFLDLDFGEHNPSRLVYQDGYQRDKHLGKDIANIKSFYISNDLVWINYIFDGKLNYVVMDMDNNIIHHSVSENDYISPEGLSLYGGLNFWPSYVDVQSNLYSILHPGDMSDRELEILSEQIKSRENISVEDNPIICCVEF